MSKIIEKKEDDTLASRREADLEQREQSFAGFPFFNFRYSYRSVSSVGEKTRVVAKEHRYEDGKLESEEFEGEMEGNVFEDAVRSTMDLFNAQVRSFFAPFTHFLPHQKK